MSKTENFISCDWGTSNFRIRLVDKETLNIIEVLESNDGVKKTYKAFKNQSEEIDQTAYFIAFLQKKIALLNLSNQKSKVVISGMASSSLGMYELEYTPFPIEFNANKLIKTSLNPTDDLEIVIVSGAKSDSDIMRGEEIQAIGIANSLPKDEAGILILPGTHSKHIAFNNGVFENFTTYMTGELFDTISTSTILTNSLERIKWHNKFEPSFLQGVQKAKDNNVMASFFSIRTNDLFEKKSKEENFYFLSGLLIGCELAYLKDNSKKIYLATSGTLTKLYKLALESLTENSIIFDEKIIDQALIIGHNKIANNHA
jgi:2-dehydro-3-deoxygalactonokinase